MWQLPFTNLHCLTAFYYVNILSSFLLPIIDIAVLWFERMDGINFESLLRVTEAFLVLVDHEEAWIPVCKNLQVDLVNEK